MKLKMKQRRITIRVIFLLVVQTVWLAGIPVQRAVMQLIPDISVSETADTDSAVFQHRDRAAMRRQANWMFLLSAVALTVMIFAVCVQRMPARTLTACKVRLND